MLKNKIYVVGISPEGPANLSSAAQQALARAEILIGGQRMLEMFPDVPARRISLGHNLSEITGLINADSGNKNIVVLASGDPNFYGIAGYLVRSLGGDAVEIIPNVSSMQLAFARIKENWDDAVFASAHSRPIEGIIDAVRGNHKVCILTDQKNNPGEIARILISEGIENCRVFVCQDLGSEKEEIVQTDLHHVADREYSTLNTMILVRDRPGLQEDHPSGQLLGISDEKFKLRSQDKSLITKLEVRAVSLAKLCLTEDSVLWDIGAGSGSVSIEASLLARKGRIYAIEKNAGDVEVIRENVQRFGRNNIEIIHTTAPDGLDGLPAPLAVFIGGSSGQMGKILKLACRDLKPGGRIVANVVTLENLQAVSRGLAENGFECEITLLNVARGKAILDLTRLEALNPVFIVTGWREPE